MSESYNCKCQYYEAIIGIAGTIVGMFLKMGIDWARRRHKKNNMIDLKINNDNINIKKNNDDDLDEIIIE